MRQEVVSFTRRVRKGGASPLSPAYMIHRSQAAGRVTLPCKHFATPPPDVPRCSHRSGIPRKYFPGQKICFLLEKYARLSPRLEEEEVVLVCVSERLLLYVTTAGAAAGGGGGGQGLPHRSPCSTTASQPPGNIWSKLLSVVFEVVYPRHLQWCNTWALHSTARPISPGWATLLPSQVTPHW